MKYLRYTKTDQRIPVEGYVLGGLVLFAVFGFLPLLKLILG
jgi:hypothetical protein